MYLSFNSFETSWIKLWILIWDIWVGHILRYKSGFLWIFPFFFYWNSVIALKLSKNQQMISQNTHNNILGLIIKKIKNTIWGYWHRRRTCPNCCCNWKSITHFPLDTVSLHLQRQYYFIDSEVKIAKYHYLAKSTWYSIIVPSKTILFHWFRGKNGKYHYLVKYLTIFHWLENI